MFSELHNNTIETTMMDQRETLPPHVLIFPLPLQGPVNSMFKLAELLCLSGLHITFLVTDHIHARLLKYSNIQSRFDAYPGFHLETISDGLPEDHPRSGDGLMEMFESLKTKNKILFKDLLTSGKLSLDSRRPVTCIIADGIMGYTCDVADVVGIPIIFVRTISACCLWVFFCLPKLIESGELPFRGVTPFWLIICRYTFLCTCSSFHCAKQATTNDDKWADMDKRTPSADLATKNGPTWMREPPR